MDVYYLSMLLNCFCLLLGLVSAAELVAEATRELCDAANALVKGQESGERLIAASKQVAASTAQLVIACQVKADPESGTMRSLEGASVAVRKATDNLVQQAQKIFKKDAQSEAHIWETATGVRGMSEVHSHRPHLVLKCSYCCRPKDGD